MKNLPSPLVGSDVNLQKYTWIKLDIVALMNSDTWRKASKVPFAGYAAINLWMAAWHQVPAGSIPADQDWIKKKADVDEEQWKIVKNIALRNFVKCTDGRLYHKTLCKMVNEVWLSKKANSRKTEKALAALKKKRADDKKKGGVTKKDVNDCNNGTPSKTKKNSSSVGDDEKNTPLLQSGIENRVEENRIEERDYRLSRAGTRDDEKSDAEKIAAEFSRLRTVYWPNDCNFSAPELTLIQQAQDWVNDAVPVALAVEVMERSMVKNINDGKANAPSNLKFCKFNIENANIEFKRLGKMPENKTPLAADRDPIREGLLFTAAGLFTKDDLINAPPIDAMSNDEIQNLITERQKNG